MAVKMKKEETVAEKIIEFAGKFLAEIVGEIVTFATKEEAEMALSASEGAEEMLAKATAYCRYKGITDKNAKTKTNVIMEFLTFDAMTDDAKEAAIKATEEAAEAKLKDELDEKAE